MKTVLVYVISTVLPPWDAMIGWSQETWDSESPEGTATYYYTDRKKGALPPRTFSFDVDADYSTMGKKDILAYRFALEHWSFDYMARVNSSCYVGKKRLLEYVQTLPDKNVFQGIGAYDYVWGGGQYIISRDVVKAMVDHSEAWNHSVMEDVAMSQLVSKLGIPMDKEGNCCSVNKREKDWLCIEYNRGKNDAFAFTDFADMRKADKHYFFRVKQDLRRHLDHYIMQQLKLVGL